MLCYSECFSRFHSVGRWLHSSEVSWAVLHVGLGIGPSGRQVSCLCALHHSLHDGSHSRYSRPQSILGRADPSPFQVEQTPVHSRYNILQSILARIFLSLFQFLSGRVLSNPFQVGQSLVHTTFFCPSSS